MAPRHRLPPTYLPSVPRTDPGGWLEHALDGPCMVGIANSFPVLVVEYGVWGHYNM